MSLQNHFHKFWLVLVKELTHSFRDKDVLLYTFLMPFLIYPVSAFLATELAMLTEGFDKNRPIRVAIYGVESPAVSYFKKAVADSKTSVQFVNMTRQKAEYALHRADIDCILSVPSVPGAHDLVLTAERSFSEAVNVIRLQGVLSDFRARQIDDGFKSRGVPNLHSAYTPVSVNVHPRKQESYSPAFMLFLISVLMMALGAAYPAVSATAEEHEKKTIESTILLPVSPITIMLGKLTSISVFAFITVAINFLSIAAIALLALVTLRHFHAFDINMFTTRITFVQFGLIVFTLVLMSFFVGAIMLVAASFCRTIRAAQNWVSLPLMVLMLAPMLSLVPDTVLTYNTALVPYYGLVLLLRDTFTTEDFGLVQLTACLSTLLFVVAFTYLSGHLMFGNFADTVAFKKKDKAS